MDHVMQCISCGSRNLWKYPAVIAPFLIARVVSLKGVDSKLLWCSRCGIAFFNPRLDGKEMGALYRGYRGPEYQAERQQSEPDYTPEINSMIGSGEAEIHNRKANMRIFMSKHLDFAAIGSVLDYGGDRGQYILEEFSTAKRAVYEISGVEAIPGVASFNDWAAVCNEKYDIVLCNHVLEHVSHPAALLTELSEAAHPDTLFYFEVPLESPFKHGFSVKHWLRRIGLKFIPGIAEPILRCTGKIPFVMHEHINKFSLGSLGELISRNGYRVLALEKSTINVGWATVPIISCMAKMSTKTN